MNKLITTVVILFISSAAVAQQFDPWDNPFTPFDAQKDRFTTTMPIEWRLVDDVKKACDIESKRVGINGFAEQDMQGCSFWYKSKCTIITKKKPTMHTVGHEIRHCFQGAWH